MNSTQRQTTYRHTNIMNPTCFVISPFGEPFDDYYSKVYQPAIVKADLKPIRGDEVYNTGAIIDDIFAAISSATLVLCDVTGKNPNVNYELGAAHALQKPAIIITQSVSDVPFDYRHLRVIVYDRTKVDWAKQLETAIHKTILTVLGDTDRALAWKPKIASEKKAASDNLEAVVISYTPDPSLATLRYRNQFIHLSTRSGDVHPGFKQFFEEIYADVQTLEGRVTDKEFVQIRKIWHDDKNGNISISIDLIHQHGEKPTFTVKELSEALHDGYGWYAHQGIQVVARVLERNIWSDSFFPNSPEYYREVENEV